MGLLPLTALLLLLLVCILLQRQDLSAAGENLILAVWRVYLFKLEVCGCLIFYHQFMIAKKLGCCEMVNWFAYPFQTMFNKETIFIVQTDKFCCFFVNIYSWIRWPQHIPKKLRQGATEDCENWIHVQKKCPTLPYCISCFLYILLLISLLLLFYYLFSRIEICCAFVSLDIMENKILFTHK